MQPGSFQISLKVFLRRDDRFLVLRDRQTGRGDLPGGRISHAEFYGDWTACVRREMEEELGSGLVYRLHEEPLFLFPHRILSAGRDGLGVAFEAVYVRGDLRLSDEHDAFEWAPVETYDPAGFYHEHLAAAVRRYQRTRSAAAPR